MTEIVMERVGKKDVRPLINWYNANTKYYHFPEKISGTKLYNIVKQIPESEKNKS